MLNGKEIISIIITALILAATISLVKTLNIFIYTLLAIFFVIIVNITPKKIVGFYLDSEIELKLWEIKRYGFKPNRYFKKPFLAGIFLPIITTAFSFGYINWFASLVFDVKAKIYKAAKRHGLYTFSEMTEYHIALIAAAGIFANLIFAVTGYLIGFSTFAKLNVYYAFYNIIPLSDLDGNKIFFGSIVLWSFLAALTLIGLLFVILVV